jgi:hypothetical protein
MKITTNAALALLCALGLGACAGPQEPKLYAWAGYQSHVYDYLRADKVSPQAQLQKMEADLEKIKAQGGQVPPGFHAHLALLNGKVGKTDAFVEHIEAEKKQFPESETFMNFLTRNLKK